MKKDDKHTGKTNYKLVTPQDRVTIVKKEFKLATPQAQRDAVAKYQKEKVDVVTIRIRKDRNDNSGASFYKVASDLSASPSFNQFVIDAMDEKIENEGLRDKVKRKLSKQQKP